MPAQSTAQMGYAALIRSGKINAGPGKQKWANELLDKSRGMSMSSLPAHVGGAPAAPKEPSINGGYQPLNRSVVRKPKMPKIGGIKAYGA